MRTIIVFTLIFSLIACTSFPVKAPSNYQMGDHFRVQPKWIEENQAELAAKLVQAIKAKHPNTADWFPLVQISNIDIETQPENWRYEPELKAQLNALFLNTSNQLYPTNKNREVINLDLKVREALPADLKPMNKAIAYPALVPYLVACYGTLILFCPATYKEIVAVEGTFSKNGVELFTLNSAGAARVAAISMYAADSSDFLDEGVAKALIAALSQLTDKFIAEVEKNGI